MAPPAAASRLSFTLTRPSPIEGEGFELAAKTPSPSMGEGRGEGGKIQSAACRRLPGAAPLLTLVTFARTAKLSLRGASFDGLRMRAPRQSSDPADLDCFACGSQ